MAKPTKHSTPTRPGKARLDQLLFDRHLAESRSRAQALIMAGLVFCDGARVDKPGKTIAVDAEIEVKGKSEKVKAYVLEGIQED